MGWFGLNFIIFLENRSKPNHSNLIGLGHGFHQIQPKPTRLHPYPTKLEALYPIKALIFMQLVQNMWFTSFIS